MISRSLLAAVAALCLAFPAGARAQRPRPAQIESPVVHPDRTVTFRFRAPNAKKVEVSTQFTRGNQELKQDTSGIWSVTLGPAEPNLYPYNFIVDGVPVADPNNMHLFPNERFKSSLVDIPGEQLAIYASQSVPHGEVRYCAFLTPEVFIKYFSPLAEAPETTNQRLKLLWLGVGREDFLYRQAVTFDEYLKEKKIEHQSFVTDGGHTWMNARHYLTETLQLYFK